MTDLEWIFGKAPAKPPGPVWRPDPNTEKGRAEIRALVEYSKSMGWLVAAPKQREFSPYDIRSAKRVTWDL